MFFYFTVNDPSEYSSEGFVVSEKDGIDSARYKKKCEFISSFHDTCEMIKNLEELTLVREFEKLYDSFVCSAPTMQRKKYQICKVYDVPISTCLMEMDCDFSYTSALKHISLFEGEDFLIKISQTHSERLKILWKELESNDKDDCTANHIRDITESKKFLPTIHKYKWNIPQCVQKSLSPDRLEAFHYDASTMKIFAKARHSLKSGFLKNVSSFDLVLALSIFAKAVDKEDSYSKVMEYVLRQFVSSGKPFSIENSKKSHEFCENIIEFFNNYIVNKYFGKLAKAYGTERHHKQVWNGCLECRQVHLELYDTSHKVIHRFNPSRNNSDYLMYPLLYKTHKELRNLKVGSYSKTVHERQRFDKKFKTFFKKLVKMERNDKIIKSIDRELISYADKNSEIIRRQWIRAAAMLDNRGKFNICIAIINSVFGISDDYENVWQEDVQFYNDQNAWVCVETTYYQIFKAFSKKTSIWLRAIFFEQAFSTRESIEKLSNFILNNFFHKTEINDLVRAKIALIDHDLPTVRRIFAKCIHANYKLKNLLNDIFSKFQCEHKIYTSHMYAYFKELLLQSEKINDEQFGEILTFIKREYKTNITSDLTNLMIMVLKYYPKSPEFWMVKAQIEIDQNNLSQAELTLEKAIDCNDNSDELWLLRSKLEKMRGNLAKARNILESGFSKNGSSVDLLLALIRFDKATRYKNNCSKMIKYALERFPTSGKLLGELTFMEDRPKRKTMISNAFEKCPNDSYVMLAASKYFFSVGKVEKSREWFERTVKLHPNFGDAWAYYYKLEKTYGTIEQQKRVWIGCLECRQFYGELWGAFKNDIDNWTFTTEELLLAFLDRIILIEI